MGWNLTFGVRKKAEGDPKRVAKICQLLGCSTTTIDKLRTNDLNWPNTVIPSQLHLLLIARALVANPPVVCFQLPYKGLSLHQGESVIKILKRHVQERGLVEDESLKKRRLARTCFFTAHHDVDYIVRHPDIDSVQLVR